MWDVGSAGLPTIPGEGKTQVLLPVPWPALPLHAQTRTAKGPGTAR